MQTTLLALLVALATMMTACGGGITKETPADFKMNLDELTWDNIEANNGKYDDKIIETTGYVYEVKTSKAAAAPSEHYFYLSASMEDKVNSVICYVPQSVESMVGKKVNVKGVLENAGAICLLDCAVYE